jgi:hypothetical protein
MASLASSVCSSTVIAQAYAAYQRVNATCLIFSSNRIKRTHCHNRIMEQRTDRLTAAYVDLAVNIAISFGLDAGLRVLGDQKAPPAVVQRC